MPRPRRARRVGYTGKFYFFKPASIPMNELKSSVLTVDEFEAIRLKDLKRLGQKEAADKMGISQPTFHRLVLSARKKIADSIVNGKGIKIEGGVYKMMRPRRFARGGRFARPPKNCVCPNCAYIEPKRAGVPCSELICPKCGTHMVRE